MEAIEGGQAPIFIMLVFADQLPHDSEHPIKSGAVETTEICNGRLNCVVVSDANQHRSFSRRLKLCSRPSCSDVLV